MELELKVEDTYIDFFKVHIAKLLKKEGQVQYYSIRIKISWHLGIHCPWGLRGLFWSNMFYLKQVMKRLYLPHFQNNIKNFFKRDRRKTKYSKKLYFFLSKCQEFIIYKLIKKIQKFIFFWLCSNVAIFGD